MTTKFELLGDWTECSKSVVGIVFQDKLGRVGLQLRDNFEGLSGAGQWSLFGGHVEPGEDLRASAQREFAEELGINFELDQFRPWLRFVPQNGLQAYHYIFELLAPVDLTEIRLGEGSGFAFYEQAQIGQLDLVASARIVLGKLYGHDKIEKF